MKLNAVAKLCDGWFYGQGKAPSKERFVYAKMIIDNAEGLWPEYEVYPNQEGELEVVFYSSDKNPAISVHFMINHRNDVTCFAEIGDKDYFEIDVPLSITDTLIVISGVKECLSDSSIEISSMNEKGVSLHRHFETPRRAESRLHARFAYGTNPKQIVRT